MNTIGIITRDQRMPFQQELIQGLHEVLSDNYEILVDSLQQDPRKPQPVSLDLSTLDGLIIIANVLSHAELQSLCHQELPITLVSHHNPDLPIPAVLQKDEDGIAQIIDYLVQQRGRQHIVFIQGDLNQQDGLRRTRAFRHALQQYKLPLVEDYILEGNFDPVTAANSMIDFLDCEQPFDAVITADYLTGCAVLDVLRLFELDIPQTVSVMAFGDGTDAREMGLSVVGVDVVEIGRQTAQHLIQQIQDIPVPTITWLDTNLVLRDT